jgi:ATP-dependent HslUV protease ATP-binding subunit HslU
LYTIIERVFEELSFVAPDKPGEKVKINKKYVEDHLGEFANASDVSRYML